MELVNKAEYGISQSNEIIAGDIAVGTGETDDLRFLTRAAHHLQMEYPLIHFK